jgi:type I restriction enzyme S subunit
MAKVKQIKIPFPSLYEQKRIVAILDRTFKAIDQAKTNAEQNSQLYKFFLIQLLSL